MGLTTLVVLVLGVASPAQVLACGGGDSSKGSKDAQTGSKDGSKGSKGSKDGSKGSKRVLNNF